MTQSSEQRDGERIDEGAKVTPLDLSKLYGLRRVVPVVVFLDRGGAPAELAIKRWSLRILKAETAEEVFSDD